MTRTELQIDEVARLVKQTPATLAKWRVRKRGPAYYKLGRHVVYIYSRGSQRCGSRHKDTMAIERRRGQWYIRFQHAGRKVRRPTGLADTNENKTAARRLEAEMRARMVGSN